MVDLKNPDYVKGLQSDLHTLFDGEAGKKVMRFLEVSCGWYQSIFSPVDRDITLVNDGKRQVVATLKTLLECSADQVVAMAKRRENG